MVAPEWELKPHAVIPRGLPVLVCILDGWGENETKDEWNACHAAATPTVDSLRAQGAQRWRTVKAHGPAVGLPTWDDMGNSEVGHNALGAGQLIDQGARLVDRALKDGSLFTQAGWQYISASFQEHTVHFIGLLSSGGVHSRANQLYQRASPRGWARHEARRSACVAPAQRRERRRGVGTFSLGLTHTAAPQCCRAASAAAPSACASTSCWTGATCPTEAPWRTRLSWRRRVLSTALRCIAAHARNRCWRSCAPRAWTHAWRPEAGACT